MQLTRFVVLLFVAYLILYDEVVGNDPVDKSRLKILETRPHLSRFSFLGLILDDKRDVLDKKQELFDDYGHMRFGKRGEESDDYGHMRFGKRD